MKKLIIYIEEIPDIILDFWHRETESENSNLNRLLYTPLIQIKNNNIMNILADCSMIKNFYENKILCNKVRWKIKKGYRWEDGNEVIADDFILWHKIKKSKYNNKGEKHPWILSNIYKIDEYTFDIEYCPQYYFANSNDSLLPVPSNILKKYWNEVELGHIKADDFFDLINMDKNNIPRSNGAYVLSFRSKEKLELIQHPYNNKKLKPKYSHIIIQKFSDNIFENLDKSKDIILDVDLTQYKNFDDKKMKEFKCLEFDDNTWVHIDFNFRNSLLSKVVYRKVLAKAINIDEILDGIDNVRRSDSFLYTGHSSYMKNNNRYDPDCIENLLYSEGWKKDIDNFFVKDNKILEFNLVTYKNSFLLDSIVEKIKEQLREVGIKLIIHRIEFDIFYSEIYYHGEEMTFDLILHAWQGNPHFEKGEMYVSKINSISNIPSKINQYNGQNISGYCNVSFDELFVQLNLEYDIKERNKILKEMNKIFINDVVAIPLCQKFKKIFYKGDEVITADAFTGSYTNNL